MSAQHRTAFPPLAPFMRRGSAARVLALSLVLGLAGAASAQTPVTRDERNAEELKTPPPPPAFDVDRALPIEMPAYSAIEFLLDPQTITLGADGIVRYVVVGRSRATPGTVNAFYEGMRCSGASIKTYATHTGGAWNMVERPEWRPFYEMRSKYGVELARQALCRGDAPRESVRDMVEHLKRPFRG